jgi:hypothetical protein
MSSSSPDVCGNAKIWQPKVLNVSFAEDLLEKFVEVVSREPSGKCPSEVHNCLPIGAHSLKCGFW